MRILHVVRQFYPMIGGLENYVLNLCYEQLKDGKVVHVVTLNRSFITNQILKPEEDLNGLKIFRIPFWGTTKYPIAFSVFRYLKNYDIIHVHAVDFFADFIAVTKPFHKKKIILTTHGGFFHTKQLAFLKKVFFNTVTRFTVKKYDSVIACSSNDYKIFKEIFDRVYLVSNGVNVEMYINTPKKLEKGTLVTVGRIDTHKQIDKLIFSIKALRDKKLDVKLIITGPDSRNIQNKLKEFAKNLGVEDFVVFMGKVDDNQLVELYSRAHLFLSASAYEGFGIAAVEALSSGTPCILNNIPSFAEIIDRNEFGILVNFNAVENVAEKIEAFLNLNDSEYSSISNKARKYAENYSWKKVAGKINELY